MDRLTKTGLFMFFLGWIIEGATVLLYPLPRNMSTLEIIYRYAVIGMVVLGAIILFYEWYEMCFSGYPRDRSA